MQVTIAGIVETSRQVITKNNERMAFLKISDLTDSIEVVAFPNIFQKSIDILIPEKCVALTLLLLIGLLQTFNVNLFHSKHCLHNSLRFLRIFVSQQLA
jgi:DNA polymerase III alpha subunit